MDGDLAGAKASSRALDIVISELEPGKLKLCVSKRRQGQMI